MARILLGGIGKREVAETLGELALDGVDFTLASDMEAAAELRSGLADYYLGTCHTGAGASLGVLVGLLGSGSCHTFGRRVPTGQEVDALLQSGKRAFGFGMDQLRDTAPVLVRAIAAHPG